MLNPVEENSWFLMLFSLFYVYLKLFITKNKKEMKVKYRDFKTKLREFPLIILAERITKRFISEMELII